MDFHVFTSHTAGSDDNTPLQMISAARLAYFLEIEAELLALKAGNQTHVGGRSDDGSIRQVSDIT